MQIGASVNQAIRVSIFRHGNLSRLLLGLRVCIRLGWPTTKNSRFQPEQHAYQLDFFSYLLTTATGIPDECVKINDVPRVVVRMSNWICVLECQSAREI